MKTKKARRCSSCKSTKHTKSQCQMHKIRRGSASVIVRTLDIDTTSPHVLTLNQQIKQKESIPSFSENVPAVRERRVVDFAQLVESHFETKRVVSENKKKDVVLVSSPLHPVFTKESYISTDKKQPPKRSFAVRLPAISLPTFPTLRVPSYHPVTYVTDKVHTMSRLLRDSVTPVRMRAAIVMLCLCALLPFPAVGYYKSVRADSSEIVSQSTNAFLSLQSSTVAALHTNVDQASVDLSTALESFASARQLVEEKHGALVSLVKLLPGIGDEVQTREAILVAGHNIAMGNTYLIKGISQAQQTGDLPLTDRITTFVYHVRAALPSYDAALVELAKVDTSTLPAEHQETFIELRVLFGAFINDMHDVVSLVDSLSEVLGGEGLRSYLIIGQNSHELRPTGGFMGSMALVSVQNGNIVRFEVPKGGTYDVQGQIQTSFKPPLPLQMINKRWELQDANWFPDFPVSAKKIISLYEESRRETVDGVIAVNARVLERLLTVLGPVTLDGAMVSDTTVINTLSNSIKEKRLEKSTEPKAVLGDLVGELQAALTQSDAIDIVQLLLTLSTSLNEKDIQVYSTDTHIQAQITSFGWAGALQQTSPTQDYLAVNVSNIGGEKSDAFVDQHVNYDVVITEEGKAYGMVTITRSYMTDVLSHDGYAPNIAYVRAYVPYGSTLVSASGFDFPAEEMFMAPESWYETDTLLDAVEQEVGFDDVSGTRITSEFNKTVFGNWMFVHPGEQKQVVLVYELPFTVFDQNIDEPSFSVASLFGGGKKQSAGYSLVIQKQSGIQSAVDVSIIYPEGWTPAWRSHDDIVFARNGATFSSELATDQVIGFVFERMHAK